LVTVSNLNLFASAGLVLQNAIENKGTKSTLFVLYGKKKCEYRWDKHMHRKRIVKKTRLFVVILPPSLSISSLWVAGEGYVDIS
jgi:hypothetical protein